jgi:hypothetical protein
MEAGPKSSRSFELKPIRGVRETEPDSVIKPADMIVSDQAPIFKWEAEWYRVSMALVSDLRREFLFFM